MQKFILPEIDIEFIVKYGPGFVYWKNIDSVYIGCNQNFATLIGLRAPDDIIGLHESKMPWAKTFPDTVTHNINADLQVMRTREKVVTEECLGIKNQNGLDIILRSEKLPLVDKSGALVGILGVSVDITDTKEKERLIVEYHANKIQQQEKFRKMAAQVAHDLGSPLAALKMVIPHCDVIPENTRNVLNKAAIRITDIAENFLSNFKPKQEDESTSDISRHITLISAEILEILTEKKYEYSKLSVDFPYDISQTGYFAFINVDVRAFKRMLSNLINNAVDAFDGGIGEVKISLDIVDNKTQIIIADNGKGMPAEIKEKILNNIAVTAGKEDGHGIGLTQVRDTLANNEGKLDIDSTIGAGTKIMLTFPRVAAPQWIAEKIELNNDDLVVILDDDDSIHYAWETRFENSAPNIKCQHFKQGNETIDFINNLNPEEKEKIFLLTDYELLRQNLNGLDVIEKTKVKRSILVTSHHNNKEVRESTQSSQTQILPKPLASMIPINVSNHSINHDRSSKQPVQQLKTVDIVFVDDDINLLDIIMEYVVKEENKVDRYHTAAEFLDNLEQYPKDTNLLLDNQFKNEAITGLELAQKLHNMGYISLYLFSNECFDKDTIIPEYLKIIAKDDLGAINKLLGNNS